jgi:hypothetical protein
MGMEVTQEIQSINNDVPLVAGKGTYVRVYLSITGPSPFVSLSNVGGLLSAYFPRENPTLPANVNLQQINNLRLDLGRELSPNTLTSMNTVTVYTPYAADIANMRGDINRSINFRLPPEWTSSIVFGTLVHFRFTPIVNGLVSDLACDNPSLPTNFAGRGCDNLKTSGTAMGLPVFYFFQAALPIKLELVSVPYTVGSTTHVPRQMDLNALISWIKRAYPANRVIVTQPSWLGPPLPGAPGIMASPGVMGSTWNCGSVDTSLVLYNLLNAFHNAFSSFRSSLPMVYGMVSDSGGWMRGCSASGTGSGPSGNPGVNWAWDVDGTYADWYGAHEIGHLIMRNHVSHASDACDGAPPAPFDSYPYANALISGADKKYFGFDIGDNSLRTTTIANGIQPRVYLPDVWSDVMSYRCNQWISDYTFKNIMINNFRNEPSRLFLYPPATGADRPTSVLLVTANIILDNSTVRLEPFWTLPEYKIVTSRPENSSFSIGLLDGKDKTLAQFPFEPKEYTDKLQNESKTALIAEIVPFNSNATQIVISQNGNILASRNVSANSPEVKITFPNEKIALNDKVDVRWESSDADGDNLTYSLLYSPDAGITWQTLGVYIKEKHAVVDLSNLPGSSNGVFRVIATDGVNSGIDDSDIPFNIPLKAPIPRIIYPFNNSTFSTRDNIVLDGDAFNLQDPSLNNTGFSWTSSKNGLLGFGPSISVTKLQPGIHDIILNAKDANGMENATKIQINVVESKNASNTLPKDSFDITNKTSP